MKIWIILLSILCMAGTWWWVGRKARNSTLPNPWRFKALSTSVIAGVIVYFVLMSLALMYLALVG